MLYKAPREHKPKGRKRTKMERARQAFRDLHRDPNIGIERLLQWYEEDCRSPPKRGRVPTPRSWLIALSEPVRTKDRMPNADWQRGVRTKPPRRKAHKI